MAATAAAAASKWRNGVFALPSSSAAVAADSLVGSLMDGYIFVSTNIVRQSRREGGSGAPAPEDNSNFHLSNCKT